MRDRMWRDLVLPLGDALTHQTVIRHLRDYETSQYWPRDRLQSTQDRLIREVVDAAYRGCAFYRELYDEAGVKPADIRGVSDLPKLPMVDKAMLRAAYPDRVMLPSKYRCREYSTSGSTGRPFTILLDDDTMSRARALMLLRTIYAGWRFGEPVLQTGMAVQRGFLKTWKDRLLRITYRSAFNLSPVVLDSYLDLIARRRLAYVTGYAQSIYLLALRARQTGFEVKLDAAVTWGSNLLPQFRTAIREAFGCETYDSYGIGEGMQIAAQSVHSKGLLHQFALHVAAEIVRDGYPVPAGERGEIVLTRLNPGAMPMVRYRVGDVGRAAVDQPDTDGINLPLWAGIDGRTSDIVHTPSGNQLIAEFFFGIMQYAPSIALFQVIQTRADTLHVKIVTTPEFVLADWERVASIIRAKGDPELKIELEIASDIPLEPSGKRRFVIAKVTTP